MKCPKCGNFDNKVLDTRVQSDGDIIRRRRECNECFYRFTTQESLLRVFPAVIKKDGRKESFSKLKLLTGMQAACQKRPISLAQMEQLVETIVKDVLEHPSKEVSSDELGKMVMNQLKYLDDVAFVRFASVYRNFDDIKEFIETLQKEEGDKTKDTATAPEASI
tara:strand:- start:16282 stop:16773 length:492 start_codon:yes stop_codon:yes gene_type:complete